MSVWKALRAVHKIAVFPHTVRFDWHKAFTGTPNPNPGPEWNIYDGFAKYVAAPAAMLIMLGSIPWFIYQELSNWLAQFDDSTKADYVLVVCVLVFILVMFRRGHLRRAARWSFATRRRISGVLALIFLCALTLVALAGPHAQ